MSYTNNTPPPPFTPPSASEVELLARTLAPYLWDNEQMRWAVWADNKQFSLFASCRRLARQHAEMLLTKKEKNAVE